MRTIESFEDYVDPAASRSITAPQVDSVTERVHGGRREFHGGVKKTTSSLENRVGENENGKY